ncbi:LolA family protein [Actinopolymorpha alba]|uniref:LolA family protein n=1 Tax=Actinopolymorpha alba TaxID=533267 RepID=UPI00039B6031|nr:hypothetical protein [Actinopolymorpha alba]
MDGTRPSRACSFLEEVAELLISRPALRWIAPIAVLAVALAVGSAGTLLRAQAAGALPSRTAEQLLVDLQTAKPGGFSGTVVHQADLGLPQLPSLRGGDGSSELSSLVSGNHTLKVWYDGPQRSRLALLGTLGESDIIRNGRDVWTWSSSSKSATHVVLPAKVKGRDPLPPEARSQLPQTPEDAAKQALAAIDPTTKVTTDATTTVAGRAAYQLILTPRDTTSLVGQVRLAIDGAKHIPLQVQVFARGASEPAFQVGFTQITFGTPSADQFTFSPPPGTKVKQVTPGEHAGLDHARKGAPHPNAKPGTAAGADRPQVVGKGWTTVVLARDVPAAGSSGSDNQVSAVLAALPKVSGAWGSGRLLKSSLFSVLVTDDGRVLAGAVSPERLYSVAESTK